MTTETGGCLCRPNDPACGCGAVHTVTPGGGGLTAAEREALAASLWLVDSGDPSWGWDNLTEGNRQHHRAQVAHVAPTVERIVAARVAEAAVQARAEVAARVEALADEWEQALQETPTPDISPSDLRAALDS